MKKRLFSSLLTLAFIVPVANAELNPLMESYSRYEQIAVDKVLTVDTLMLSGGIKVTLIGIEGPNPPKFREIKRDANGFIIPDDDPTTPFEVEALRFVRGLAEKNTVRLEFDARRRDDSGTLLAYVFLPDGKMLNEEALRFGYARLGLTMPNMKYAQRLRNAYKESRREMRGLQGNW